jgi:glycerophosphoryl diester phosphodiesterase
MIIFAHRANRNGVIELEENTLSAVEECLSKGWGIETDIRRTPGGEFYISHDAVPRNSSNAAEAYCAVFRRFPSSVIAMNIKELGYEPELVQFFKVQGVTDSVFLFDMELLEEQPGSAVKRFRECSPTIRLAARVSDRGESIKRALMIGGASVIWLDEFDSLWVCESDIRALKEAGRTIYAISPEIHGFTLDAAKMRWEALSDWGVDGICTDFPMLLERQLDHI